MAKVNDYGFKKIRELVLFNVYGCEIDRKPYNTEEDYETAMRWWGMTLTAGDRIEIIERESEF